MRRSHQPLSLIAGPPGSRAQARGCFVAEQRGLAGQAQVGGVVQAHAKREAVGSCRFRCRLSCESRARSAAAGRRWWRPGAGPTAHPASRRRPQGPSRQSPRSAQVRVARFSSGRPWPSWALSQVPETRHRQAPARQPALASAPRSTARSTLPGIGKCRWPGVPLSSTGVIRSWMRFWNSIRLAPVLARSQARPASRLRFSSGRRPAWPR